MTNYLCTSLSIKCSNKAGNIVTIAFRTNENQYCNLQMDLLDHIWNSFNNMIFGTKDDDPLPEPTVAPFNSNPVDVDMNTITTKTWKLIPIDNIIVTPPPEVQKLFNEIFHDSDSTTAFPSTNSSMNENLTNSTQGTLRSTIGKTVEIIQDITTESSNSGLNNTTLKGKVSYDPAQVNLYTILALVLVIVTLICFGIIMWCRKNKLKTEKRNQYPVFSVTNSEYINPKSLNNEKIKNVP